MMTCYDPRGTALSVSGDALPAGTVWIDLVDPDAADMAFVLGATGLDVPRRSDLVEIESSSRLRTVGDALCFSAPVLFRRAGDDIPRATPIGLTLTPERLLSVRFEALATFTDARATLAAARQGPTGGVGPFVQLLETIVDSIADGLEGVGAQLDGMSQRIFGHETTQMGRHMRPRQEAERQRAILQAVGRSADITSNVRDSLLGIGRIATYALKHAGGWLPEGAKQRLDVVGADVQSLDDYKSHLSDKSQFLLDATLGLQGIAQNDIFRVLTVVSVVGIPPTLLAGVWGMNFKDMPELSWPHAYAFGLAVIVLSGLLPLGWFKVRGWL